MPNGYVVVPNVVTGPLTITGDFIQIGAAAPFTRIGKNTVGQFLLSSNLASDIGTRDVTSQAAWAIKPFDVQRGLPLQRITSGGVGVLEYVGEVNARSGTSTSHTGTTTEDVVRRVVIRGNALGATGSFRVSAFLTATVQGGVATTIRLKFGGTLIHVITDSLGTPHWIEAIIWNNNATGAQRSVSNGYNAGGTFSTNNATPVLDTTLDQNLDLTIQNGATTDNWFLHYFEVYDFAGSEVNGFNIAI